MGRRLEGPKNRRRRDRGEKISDSAANLSASDLQHKNIRSETSGSRSLYLLPLHVQSNQLVVEPGELAREEVTDKIVKDFPNLYPTSTNQIGYLRPPGSQTALKHFQYVAIQIDSAQQWSFMSRLGKCATFSKITVHTSENTIFKSRFRKVPLLFLSSCLCFTIAVFMNEVNICIFLLKRMASAIVCPLNSNTNEICSEEAR